MGLKSSPSLCRLVVNKLVQRIINTEPGRESDLFLNILMDGSILVWRVSMEEWEEFVARMNELHPSLKFAYTASYNEIQFLDLIIYKSERFRTLNILDVRCFTKPTEIWCYLDRSSCHSPSVFRGFIKGEIIRYHSARNSNNLETYLEKKIRFLQRNS